MSIKKHNGINYIVGDPDVKDSGEIYKVSNRWRTPDQLFWDYGNKCYKSNSILVKENYVYGLVTKELSGFFQANQGTNILRVWYLTANLHLFDFHIDPYTINMNITAEKLAKYYRTTKEGDYRLKHYGHQKKKYEAFNIEVYSYKDLEPRQKDKINKALKKVKSRFPLLEKLFNKSVGIEFETSAGHLPENICLENGLIPLKDGSIYGHEYVTVPYMDNIVERTVQSCTALRYGTAIDHLCSTHVHIGGLRKDRTFITSLYELWSYIQDEFYELIVINKRHIDYISNKRHGPKDHCKSVPKIQASNIAEYYKIIFTLFNSSQHPNRDFHRGKLVHDDSQKWNIDCRYYNLNMINLLNGNNVIEFRIHGPTLNEIKLVNYLFILNAVIEFASKYSNIVIHRKEKLYLEKILKVVYKDQPEIAKVLINYVNYRKNIYLANLMNNDIFGLEIEDDTPPIECNLLALFGYDMLDNVYQKRLEPIMSVYGNKETNIDWQLIQLKENPLKVNPFEGDIEDEEFFNDEEEEEEMILQAGDNDIENGAIVGNGLFAPKVDNRINRLQEIEQEFEQELRNNLQNGFDLRVLAELNMNQNIELVKAEPGEVNQ